MRWTRLAKPVGYDYDKLYTEFYCYRSGGAEPKPKELHVIFYFDRPELCQFLDLGHV